MASQAWARAGLAAYKAFARSFLPLTAPGRPAAALGDGPGRPLLFLTAPAPEGDDNNSTAARRARYASGRNRHKGQPAERALWLVRQRVAAFAGVPFGRAVADLRALSILLHGDAPVSVKKSDQKLPF